MYKPVAALGYQQKRSDIERASGLAQLTLTHLGSTMRDQNRTVQQDRDESSTLVHRLDPESESKLGRNERNPALAPPVLLVVLLDGLFSHLVLAVALAIFEQSRNVPVDNGLVVGGELPFFEQVDGADMVDVEVEMRRDRFDVSLGDEHALRSTEALLHRGGEPN
mgnify:FL=1